MTPEHVRALNAAGYTGLTLDPLLTMRIHSIDADSIRSLSRKKRSESTK